MSKPSPDAIRRALASLKEATAAVDEIHDQEQGLPDDAPPSLCAAVESAAEAAISTERQCRDVLIDLVARFAGPPPCVVIVDGSIIAITDDADGMTVMPADRVLRID
jgi:hypothetical protein